MVPLFKLYFGIWVYAVSLYRMTSETLWFFSVLPAAPLMRKAIKFYQLLLLLAGGATAAADAIKVAPIRSC